ncbi:MAG: acetyl-CoA carboxylase carboxyl transferase subunit beta [Candidatus Pelagibacter sp.]|nr:acetyl-CoA carboxylase carboxyl transferase subunit beta [Candidatus Pelagibacter sp.]|tara:strand:- start:601 stop:1536 length:936 start_codon:yes stop_codon:yes gene_type:complete
MNWITKALKIGQKIKTILKKRPTKEETKNSDWTSCCIGPILKKDLENNFFICSACGKHHRINCRQRFDLLFGKDNYKIIKTPIPGDEDPLNWKDTKTYSERLKIAKEKTGQESAVMIATGFINDVHVTVGAVNFEFIGGSIGSAEGEAIIYGVQHAIDNNTSFVMFASGGGQRMFQSPVALANMTRTTLAINELKKNKLPYLVCLVDPCTGGISASFAMLGDIHFAEPGALIAFAGRRVVQATVKEELPNDFQTAEFLEKHGFVDKIVNRKELKSEIRKILSILLKKNSEVNLKYSNETSENNSSNTKVAS